MHHKRVGSGYSGHMIANCRLAATAVIGALLSLSTAAAQGAAIEARATPGIVLGAKLGGNTGTPLNDFGLSYTAELELGYLLPLPAPIYHALEVFAGAGYSAPSLSDQSTQRDARLPGDGIAHFSIQQRVLTWNVGALLRVPFETRWVAPYVAAGYRGFFLDSQVDGSAAGRSFGENHEYGYEHGCFGALGIDVFLGPGAILAELQLAYAPRDTLVLRDTNLGGLQLFVGYRFIIGGPARHAQPQSSARGAAGKSKPALNPSSPNAVAVAPAGVVVSSAAAEAAHGDTPSEVPSGQIRGNVRAFSGAPLRATITVQPGGMQASTAADGTFSLDVTPGKYTVQLRAPGYKSQDRDVIVDEDGITVLNVELGKR
jgi:Carboxypeptidase regulatory-like domain